MVRVPGTGPSDPAEHDKAIAVAEKNVIDNAIVRAKSEKISAERDRDKVMAEKNDFEMERDQTEAIIVQNLEKYESLKKNIANSLRSTMVSLADTTILWTISKHGEAQEIGCST